MSDWATSKADLHEFLAGKDVGKWLKEGGDNAIHDNNPNSSQAAAKNTVDGPTERRELVSEDVKDMVAAFTADDTPAWAKRLVLHYLRESYPSLLDGQL